MAIDLTKIGADKNAQAWLRGLPAALGGDLPGILRNLFRDPAGRRMIMQQLKVFGQHPAVQALRGGARKPLVFPGVSA